MVILAKKNKKKTWKLKQTTNIRDNLLLFFAFLTSRPQLLLKPSIPSFWEFCILHGFLYQVVDRIIPVGRLRFWTDNRLLLDQERCVNTSVCLIFSSIFMASTRCCSRITTTAFTLAIDKVLCVGVGVACCWSVCDFCLLKGGKESTPLCDSIFLSCCSGDGASELPAVSLPSSPAGGESFCAHARAPERILPAGCNLSAIGDCPSGWISMPISAFLTIWCMKSTVWVSFFGELMHTMTQITIISTIQSRKKNPAGIIPYTRAWCRRTPSSSHRVALSLSVGFKRTKC